MRRLLFLVAGWASVALGTLGLFLPLLPTVPFMLLAAFCFARSSPRLERWLLEHRHYGPHLRAWRRSRSISRAGKRAAWLAFAISAAIGMLTLSFPWSAIPLLAAVIGSSWIASLPTTPPTSAEDGEQR